MTDTQQFSPFKAAPSFAERVWGRISLAPWYPADATGTDKPVGEAWLTGPDCLAATGDQQGSKVSEIAGDFPLLIKLLFPDDKLSLQVHPNDEQALTLGLPRGKSECWYVLDAEPDARVACGVVHGTTPEQVEAGIRAGTIEQLMQWLPVQKDDMIYVDAGTLHGIGAGMTLLEVQETCDVTYRLYDYGRQRDLHLKEGLAVLKMATKAGKVKPRSHPGYTRLIETEHFVVDRMEIQPGTATELAVDGLGCIVGLAGEGAVNEVRFGVAEAVLVPDGSVTLTSQQGCTFLRCVEPAKDEDH